jgi:hypothetical protein
MIPKDQEVPLTKWKLKMTWYVTMSKTLLAGNAYTKDPRYHMDEVRETGVEFDFA